MYGKIIVNQFTNKNNKGKPKFVTEIKRVVNVTHNLQPELGYETNNTKSVHGPLVYHLFYWITLGGLKFPVAFEGGDDPPVYVLNLPFGFNINRIR